MRTPGFILRGWRWLRSRFEGAVTRQGASWIPAAVQGARFDASSAARTELLRKSRYFERNNATFNRLVDLFESYTVGPGLVFQPASSSEEWNRAAKKWWDDWSRTPDVSSRSSLGTLQGLTARQWFVDGESFIMLTKGESGIPRLQLIEGHLVKTPARELENALVVDGVRLAPSGRPVSYYIGQEVKAGAIEIGAPTPADFVVHIFEPSRSGQVRGLPMVYPVINDLHDLDDLQILEMKAARQAAGIGIIQKNETGEGSSQDLLRNGGTISTSSDGERADYYRNSLGGDALVIKNGDSIEQFRTDRPSVVTQEYWRKLEGKVCAGIGIPYVLAYPDTMQGTVYRGALDMANQWFRCRHTVMADAYRRIYEYVMAWARFNVPTLQDPPEDWKSVRIHPPRAVNVDVGRSSAAMIAELAAGATDYELIYGEQGLDWRERFTALSEQQKFAAQLGLRLQVGQMQSEAQVQVQQQQAQQEQDDNELQSV